MTRGQKTFLSYFIWVSLQYTPSIPLKMWFLTFRLVVKQEVSQKQDFHGTEGVKTTGLLVAAFDRAGPSYNLTCKYTSCPTPATVSSPDGRRMSTTTAWTWTCASSYGRSGLGNYTIDTSCANRREERRRRSPSWWTMVTPDGSLGLVLLHYENDLLEPERQAAADEPDEASPV